MSRRKFFAVTTSASGGFFELFGDHQVVFLSEEGARLKAYELNADPCFGVDGDKTLSEATGESYVIEEWGWPDVMDNEHLLEQHFTPPEVKQSYYGELLSEYGEGAAAECAECYKEELDAMFEEVSDLLDTVSLGGTEVELSDLSADDLFRFIASVAKAWRALG